MTVDELIAHYRKVKEQHGPLSKSLAEKLGYVASAFGDMEADSMGCEFVDAAYDKWDNHSPGTIKRNLVQLRAVLNRAVRDGILARMPVIDLPYVNDTVYVDVDSKQVGALLRYLRWTERSWYPLALVLCHTGARLGEALSLTEGSFTRHGTRIAKPVGRRSKTIERTIPYTALMRESVEAGLFVKMWPQEVAKESVSTCLGRVLDSATAALGLPTLRVHDLRHAFAAVLAENGADLADLTAALGHSNTAMAMRYRGLVKGRLNTIMGAI